MLSRRVHVERTIFYSLSLNPLLSGCLSATAQAILVATDYITCGFARARSRTTTTTTATLEADSPAHTRARSRTLLRTHTRTLLFVFPCCGCCSVCGNSRLGSSWPQEEEPRGRAAGAQKSRRSSPAAHPGNHRFLPCFLSRRIPRPHQRLKWPMAVVVSVQSAPATKIAALVSVQSAPETEMAALVSVQSAPETEMAAWGSAPD